MEQVLSLAWAEQAEAVACVALCDTPTETSAPEPVVAANTVWPRHSSDHIYLMLCQRVLRRRFGHGWRGRMATNQFAALAARAGMLLESKAKYPLYLAVPEPLRATMMSSIQSEAGIRGGVVLVVPYDKRTTQSNHGASSPSMARAAAELRCDEAAALVEATGYSVATRILAPRDDAGLAKRTGGHDSSNNVHVPARRRHARGSGGLPIGKGKISEIAAAVARTHCSVVVIDCELSPVHARQLRREIRQTLRHLMRQRTEWTAIREEVNSGVSTSVGLPSLQQAAAGSDTDGDVDIAGMDLGRVAAAVSNLTVTDRQGVILDIFALRAKTREAKLQVELAAIERRRAHLRAGGSAELPTGARMLASVPGDGTPEQPHSLDQQRAAGGGFGFIGGAGERQIELDRRRLSARADAITEQLRKAERTRAVTHGRQASARGGAGGVVSGAMRPVTVALAGYTNAGKSHLARALTRDAAAFQPEDALFATLGSTHRRLPLPSGASCRLVDTVGFVEGLPHALVASFRATLSDVAEADLLLHVRDPTHPRFREHARVVDETVTAVVAAAAATAEARQRALCKPFGGKPVVEVWSKSDLLLPKADPFAQVGQAEPVLAVDRMTQASPSPATLQDEGHDADQTALGAGAASNEELCLVLAGQSGRSAGDSTALPLRSADSMSNRNDDETAARPQTISTSAVTGEGLADLLRAIDGRVLALGGLRRMALVLDGAAEGDIQAQAWLFSDHGGVSVTDAVAVHPSSELPRRDGASDDGLLIRALLTPDALARFQSKFPLQASRASIS